MVKLKELKTLLQKYFGISSPKPIETKKPIRAKLKNREEKLSGLISEIGKNVFGVRVRVEWGRCPYCETITQLLSLHTNYFRCSLCHETIKQYVNGHIAYLPVDDKLTLRHEPKA
jgi:hypothetical protein